MSIARQLDRMERELEGIVSPQGKQIYLLQQMLPLCGSDFSAFNLMDEQLRVVGGVAWPITEDRAKQMQLLNPVLGALLWSSPIGEVLRFCPERKAAIVDDERIKNSLIYSEVYRPMGMHHLGTFRFPSRGGNFVAVGISSSNAPFTRSAAINLERMCNRFESLIVMDLPSMGSVLGLPLAGDWRIPLDASLQPEALTDYLMGLFAFFFGDLRTWLPDRKLPPELLAQLRQGLEAGRSSVVPGDKSLYSFSKVREGRRLNILLEQTKQGHYLLTCVEDSLALKGVQTLSEHCQSLKRDSYAIYRCCLAMLDGKRSYEDVLRSASLVNLKEASAKRLISRARAILYEIGLGI
ncbi:hypothetical protein [Pelagicoccus albus]|uniref:Uncharacterized protein n=1 Tax=Pelagicoccus albus TaxID=415222 RepID=A0A7X1B737_9BACT|nr:hypothetical protein [Pelagicoccus albus]MBC2605610.1 hypothetical protein [Pelagicoccus albus]